MPRPAKIWLRKSNGYWYVTRDGKKIRLSKDKAEAERAFHALLAIDSPPEARSHGRPTFKAVADDYLATCKESCTPETFIVRLQYLQSFCDRMKGRRAPDIRGTDVTAWLNANNWNKSTRHLAIQIIKAAFNHAVNQGEIAASPVAKLKKGSCARRERILTTEEREKIRIRTAKSGFGDFLAALEQTGARPFSEVAKLTADMIDWEAGSITLKRHKNVDKGKRRVIYLTPALKAILRRLSEKYPEGLLFRTRENGIWTRSMAHCWMVVFDRELGIKGLTTYCWRHSYICDAIERGLSLVVIAELVGSSPRMLIQHYSHMEQKKDMLREAAMKAVTG